MNINDLKNRLGDYVNDISFAKSFKTRGELLVRICEEIKSNGFDIDEEYLKIINEMDTSSLNLEIRYVPLYVATSIARLSWKEHDKDEESDHQEYIRFSTIFYAEDYNKNNRINNLDLMKVIDKKKSKCFEQKINDNQNNEEKKYLPANCSQTPSVVLDVDLGEDEIYPLETSYILSRGDIEKNVNDALNKTKSYHKLSSKQEKWSSIESINVEVILVPIAKLTIGNHVQYINCANEKLDIQYEKNKTITKNLTTARMLTYPFCVIFIILSIVSFFTKRNLEKKFDLNFFIPLRNMGDIIWLILVIIGIVFMVIAIPSRKGIVRRAEKQKDRLKVCKVFTHLLIDVCVGLLVLLLMCF